jgi:PQQ-like domain
MTKRQLRFSIICLTLALVTPAVAKRMNPKPVAPVVSHGIRYSADRDGRDQYVVATDASTGKQLWRVKVFHTHIKFWVEEDVQWVFITDLKVSDNSLFVRDEKARCYSVDLNNQRVRKALCSRAFATAGKCDAVAQGAVSNG